MFPFRRSENPAACRNEAIWKGTYPELSFVRTSKGVEVDVVIDRGASREFIEIKNTSTFRPDLLKGLRSLKGKADKGLLLYRGKSMDYEEGLRILNFSDYLLGDDGEVN